LRLAGLLAGRGGWGTLRHRARPSLGKARQAALPPAEAASPLAERPYDLRHARLSTWLNAGVAPAQVAEWAGNSVPVLLRVYSKCLTDSEQTALQDPQAE
jgi:hypothetical protein